MAGDGFQGTMDRTLLQQLYGAVTSPGQLHGFVDNLARAVGCHSGSLTVRDLTRGTHVSLVAAGSMADPRTVERFNQESSYTRDNLWLARSASLIKTGAVLVSDDAATIEEMRPTRYYRDFLHQIDTLHSIAMCATVTPGSLTMMTFVGSEQRGNFTQAERALCQSLSPHWVNAFSLRQAFQRAWKQPGTLAMLLLDRQLRVMSTNADGEDLLLSRVLRARRGMAVEPLHPTSRALFAEAYRKVSAGADNNSPEGMFPLYMPDGSLCGFGSIKAYGTLLPGEGVASYALVVNTLARRSAEGLASTLRNMFALTPAEAMLAIAVYEYGELATAAQWCKVTTATARTRLQAIFEKTRVHRQIDLTRMIENLNSMLARAPADPSTH